MEAATAAIGAAMTLVLLNVSASGTAEVRADPGFVVEAAADVEPVFGAAETTRTGGDAAAAVGVVSAAAETVAKAPDAEPVDPDVLEAAPGNPEAGSVDASDNAAVAAPDFEDTEAADVCVFETAVKNEVAAIGAVPSDGVAALV